MRSAGLLLYSSVTFLKVALLNSTRDCYRRYECFTRSMSLHYYLPMCSGSGTGRRNTINTRGPLSFHGVPWLVSTTVPCISQSEHGEESTPLAARSDLLTRFCIVSALANHI